MATARTLPIVQAFLLCDHLYQDKETHKFVVAGIFTGCTAPRYPATQAPSYLYMRIVGWSGKTSFRFRLLSLTDGNTVLGTSGPIPIEVKDRLEGFQCGLRMPAFQVPKQGAYAVDILWGEDDTPLIDWRFVAKLVPQPKGKEGSP